MHEAPVSQATRQLVVVRQSTVQVAPLSHRTISTLSARRALNAQVAPSLQVSWPAVPVSSASTVHVVLAPEQLTSQPSVGQLVSQPHALVHVHGLAQSLGPVQGPASPASTPASEPASGPPSTPASVPTSTHVPSSHI